MCRNCFYLAALVNPLNPNCFTKQNIYKLYQINNFQVKIIKKKKKNSNL